MADHFDACQLLLAECRDIWALEQCVFVSRLQWLPREVMEDLLELVHVRAFSEVPPGLACEFAALSGRVDWLEAARAKTPPSDCKAIGKRPPEESRVDSGPGPLSTLECVSTPLITPSEPCPWNKRVIALARASGHEEVAQWALVHGCPPN